MTSHDPSKLTLDLRSRLKRVFGYDEFRPLQLEIMQSTLEGRDTVAILPTGAGKSLCYQLPALVRPGLTVVISPLIALMKDQVDQLQAAGVAATFLNSSLDPATSRQRTDQLKAGRYKLLYVAPERLMLEGFLTQLADWKISALAVDEAHCISEWGHDFRPDYRNLSKLRSIYPDLPMLALTATATPRVREDIVLQLQLRNPAIYLSSFNRPNLSYQVIPKAKPERQVWEFASARPEDSGIVYCHSRKSTESLATVLRAEGLSAVAYHAGMEPHERTKNQEAFLRDESRIVCATIAFGMGINKPNVRYVIHADLPKNIESYYQETGRAGRDGLPADCLLLFSAGDKFKQLRFLEEMTDMQAQRVARNQLDQMVAYAEEMACRRASLLGYFGEKWPHDNCGSCDNCLAPRETWDATIDAQKLLSCIYRIRQKSNLSVGLPHVAEVLTGGKSEKIQRWGHHEISTYGIGKDKPRTQWVELGRQLTRLGLAEITSDVYATIILTQRGLNALKQRENITLTRAPTRVLKDQPATSASTVARSGDIPCDEKLFQQLRVLRKSLADERNVPAYVVFSDVTLRHIARRYPRSSAEFLSIPGVGERKLAEFGEAFVAAVSDWLGGNPRLAFSELKKVAPRKARVTTEISGTARETLNRFRGGKTITEIANARQLTPSTIESHLAQAIELGEQLDPNDFYSKEESARMREAFQNHEGPALGPIFEKLGGTISYGKLKIFRAFARQKVRLA
jgi:ATP-dependent DNA helicase RecQ